MLRTLRKDADRALDELWGLLHLSTEWKVELVVGEIECESVTADREDAAASIEADLTNFLVRITLSAEKMRDGAALWSALAHECLHLYQAELIQSICRLEETRPSLRPLAVELVQVSEMANIRVERLFLRAYPCPRWLRARTYGDSP